MNITGEKKQVKKFDLKVSTELLLEILTGNVSFAEKIIVGNLPSDTKIIKASLDGNVLTLDAETESDFPESPRMEVAFLRRPITMSNDEAAELSKVPLQEVIDILRSVGITFDPTSLSEDSMRHLYALAWKLQVLLDETAHVIGMSKEFLMVENALEVKNPTAVDIFMAFAFIGCPIPFNAIADWNHQKRQAAINWVRQVHAGKDERVPEFLRGHGSVVMRSIQKAIKSLKDVNEPQIGG